MQQDLDKDGDDGLRRAVPADRKDYRDSFVRLVKESRQDPKGLRSAVADFLRGRGCATRPSHNSQGVYWLNWGTNADLADVARARGCGDFFLSWGMTFTYHEVRAGFYLYQTGPEELALMDQLKGFMQATPINRHKRDQYPMKDTGYGWHQVYDQEILSKDELADMSRKDATDGVVRRLEDFIRSEDSEYRRIEDYLNCLAFRFDDRRFKLESSP